MHNAEHPEIMLGLGLDAGTAALIEEAAGPGFRLRNLPADASAWLRGCDEGVRAAWISWAAWRALPKSRRRACRDVDGLRRILVLDEAAGATVETEQVLGEGFLTALRPPFTRGKVREAILRMRELDALSTALRKKNDEVLLERELLARKTAHLAFLNRLLSHAASSLEVGAILVRAATDMRRLLPVRGLCAVFWNRGEQAGGVNAELYLHCRMQPADAAAWRNVLLDAARNLSGTEVADYRERCLVHAENWKSGEAPETGRLLMLPLSGGGEVFGCLALLTEKDLRLARDQVQTLNAAASHLALALRNAMLFHRVKREADHDGLTGIANRRSFDERLGIEVLRHDRYGEPLALLFFDVDCFKEVNDTLGHQTGDAVLRELAALLAGSLRATDFPARYGGEEFAVILPHTDRDQAALLAERIRGRVAGREFDGSRRVRVSVSAGVAALGEGGTAEDILRLADQSLYLAKNSGRNRIVVAGADAAGAPNEIPERPRDADVPSKNAADKREAVGGM